MTIGLLKSAESWKGEPFMTREETIERLVSVDEHLRATREGTDSPAIAACVREMEVQCHVALAYLGVVPSIFPDFLGSSSRESSDR